MKKLIDIFNEFEDHLLTDEKPSVYFKHLLPTGIFFDIFPLTMLGDLIKVDQPPDHHPEGNAWNHTMLVVDNAADRRSSSEDPRVFMWAALLHDIGKTPTTRIRRGKVTSYDHDKFGERMAVEFLKTMTEDIEFIHKVSKLVRWHMQTLFVVKSLPFADIEKMSKEASINEVALLSTCDRLGRGGMTKERYDKEMDNIKIFVNKCNAFNER